MHNRYLSIKKSDSNFENMHFHSLSPTSSVENGEYYFNALNWALNNRKTKNIRNIAITGPYGSGKSSILCSFQEKNVNNDLHFLNVSLATFKEDKQDDGKTKNENLLRLIELSILQQLFYKEKDKNLLDSRLKKIQSFTWKKLFLIAISCLLFFVAIVNCVKAKFFIDIFRLNVSDSTETIIYFFSLVISIIGIITFVFKSIRIATNFKISKLNINNAEIEISPEINKSVLNHNLEEILYFFEVTRYNVVIIEDLDRFQETEIFTKLREINLLINNSKKINKDIVFIYAIRDDMFIDKDRTKFFDFLIPVIPVINTSNS
ncbi:hypothetical protein EZS27_037694, partial [termite gut metagenome]